MAEFYMPPRKKLSWLLVDLDQTLAWTIWPQPGIGEPITENIAKLKDAIDRGYKVMIYTARPWSDYEMIKEWCRMEDIPIKGIICGKPLAHRIIDDRAIHPREEEWV